MWHELYAAHSEEVIDLDLGLDDVAMFGAWEFVSDSDGTTDMTPLEIFDTEPLTNIGHEGDLLPLP